LGIDWVQFSAPQSSKAKRSQTIKARSMKPLKNPDQVRAEFDRVGRTFAQWARDHEVDLQTVYDVLAGRKKGRRGQAHKVAVLLGLKHGVVDTNRSRAADQPKQARRPRS
jgi:gp16 family phage-associated protein